MYGGDLLPVNICLHKNPGAQKMNNPHVPFQECVFTQYNCANIDEECPDIPGNKKTSADKEFLVCKKFLQFFVTVYKVANVPVKVSTGDLRGSVLPLPGVFDHHDFGRTTKELGKCALCGAMGGGFSLGEPEVSARDVSGS
ncbi:hypothetical protein [Methanolacinia petrolearia]|uniref:hypothetical protein n=1 Tax=Methanolacinia petrolearia TaxID=54120 RepID=UPI003BAC6297